MQHTEKFTDALASMFKDKRTRTVIIAVLAALLLAALIIAIVVAVTPKKAYIDGEYVLSISTGDEMTSSYIFDGSKLTNVYYDGTDTVTTEYEYYISKRQDGNRIVMTNTETGKIQVFSYSEVTEGEELTAIIINSVWYYKK